MSEFSAHERARYHRQIILPGHGEAGQQRLKNARVLLVGAGGLGSPAALYLAAAGVGTLGLCDNDTVAIHNLQRQIIHDTAGEGIAKTRSAQARLQALNPLVQLNLHETGIHLDNAMELLKQYDLVVDGSDNFPTRYLVSDAACLAGVPYVYGSIFQYEGQVSLFHPRQSGPSYRCLFPHIPEPGSVPSCSEAGVFGALCGLIGSLQAMEAIKHITEIGESLIGRLLCVDALTMRFRTLNIKPDPQSPLLGNKPSITSLRAENYQWQCDAPSSNTDTLPLECSLEAAHTQLTHKPPPFLLDVREPEEWAICKLEGAHLIPLGQIAERAASLPKDQQIIVYCHHGMRSLNAARRLQAAGFQATSMQGGIDAWAKTYAPEMTRY